MLRRLSRLLIIALLLALAAFAVSKLMGGDDDDFDDFDDLDSGFDFQETPVEIDVPASDDSAQGSSTTAMSSASAATGTTGSTTTVRLTDTPDETTGTANQTDAEESGRLIDINGIGPAYEARLHSIGISNLEDLAHADPEAIASQLDVIGGAGEVQRWVEQAQAQHTHQQ